jgi:hypothetical protein
MAEFADFQQAHFFIRNYPYLFGYPPVLATGEEPSPPRSRLLSPWLPSSQVLDATSLRGKRGKRGLRGG